MMAGRSPRSPESWTALRIALAEGQFPIFPWFSFYIAGVACGRFVAEDKLGRIGALAGGAAAVGLAGVATSFVKPAIPGTALWRTTKLNIPFFPASPTLVALLLALVLAGIWAVMAWDRRRPLGANNVLVTLGRASLTLLLLHVWLFREATRPIGVWQALEANEAMAVLIAFLILAAIASRLWQRIDYRYGAEWVLRKLAP